MLQVLHCWVHYLVLGNVVALTFSARKRKPFSGQAYSKVSPRNALTGFFVRLTPEYADTLNAVTSSSLSRLCGSAAAACGVACICSCSMLLLL